MPNSFSHSLAHVTGGRRYGFVIMTYHERYSFFEQIRTIVAKETGLECIRADDIPGAGEDLRAKIHSAIDSAAFIIADISDPRPNIYYEVGYSIARDKPILLFAQSDVEIPTDLLGVEIIRYTDSKGGRTKLEESLRNHLEIHADSHVSLLRAMVVPANPHPSFILASPKQPTPQSRSLFHRPERRTYGDYLGLVGILGAFGSVYGEHFAPEILHAARIPDDLPGWDANLYLIGSDKVNPAVREFLKEMQKGHPPNWWFHPAPGEDEKGDYVGQLSGKLQDGNFHSPDRRGSPNDYEDFGLIVRGPHPRHPGRTVMIMAGPHSLGTGAACLAATNSQLIRKIVHKFTGTIDLAARDQTIWLLVKGAPEKDMHISPEGVTILKGGVY